MPTPLACVMLDVGGTLWSSRWTATTAITLTRVAQLRDALPQLTLERAQQLEQRLLERNREYLTAMRAANTHVRDIRVVIRAAAEEWGFPIDEQTILAIRGAMRVSPTGNVAPFPGAVELLRQIKAWGMTCIAVSNATWRDGEAYRRDFADAGIGQYFDAIVSSVDVKLAKPHPAMFEAALRAAQCPARECVMIGNSEQKDMQPALALGMRAILVAYDRVQPVESAAHAVVDSLAGAEAVLRTWRHE